MLKTLDSGITKPSVLLIVSYKNYDISDTINFDFSFFVYLAHRLQKYSSYSQAGNGW